MDTLSMNQALGVWSDLWNAYYGKHGYGGNVAEIYAYRLMPYSPTYQMSHVCAEAFREQNETIEKSAAFSMRSLAWKFANDNNCFVTIDGEDIDTWRFKNPLFSHRCHVKVIPK